MTETDCIRKAHSCAADPRKAAQEFHAMVAQPGMALVIFYCCLLYTSPSPRDGLLSRMPSSA